MYQVSIPVNPGNSGGPLCDENGNIIGVIRGKISGAEATGFAIKAAHILKHIHKIGADSVLVNSNKKLGLKGIKRTEQIKRMNPYVFNVLVYKNE
jgi:S1-C subfamily serine protease